MGKKKHLKKVKHEKSKLTSESNDEEFETENSDEVLKTVEDLTLTPTKRKKKTLFKVRRSIEPQTYDEECGKSLDSNKKSIKKKKRRSRKNLSIDEETTETSDNKETKKESKKNKKNHNKGGIAETVDFVPVKKMSNSKLTRRMSAIILNVNNVDNELFSKKKGKKKKRRISYSKLTMLDDKYLAEAKTATTDEDSEETKPKKSHKRLFRTKKHKVSNKKEARTLDLTETKPKKIITNYRRASYASEDEARTGILDETFKPQKRLKIVGRNRSQSLMLIKPIRRKCPQTYDSFKTTSDDDSEGANVDCINTNDILTYNVDTKDLSTEDIAMSASYKEQGKNEEDSNEEDELNNYRPSNARSNRRKTPRNSKANNNKNSFKIPYGKVRKLPPQNDTQTFYIPALTKISYQKMQVKASKDLNLALVISNAPKNSEIIIPAGSYTLDLNITKPVSLVGNDNVTITSSGLDNAITVKCEGVSLKGMKIVQKATSTYSAVSVESGSVNISNCNLISQSTPAIISSGISLIYISSSKVSASSSPPIFATEDAMLAIENTEVKDSASTGIVLCERAVAKITKCSIQNHKESGIICRDLSRFFLDTCSISDCAFRGAEIGTESACVFINKCTFEKCGISGVCVYGFSTADIRNSTFSNCSGPGIDFRGACGVFTSGNKFVGCEEPSLIYVQEAATVESINDSFEKSSAFGCSVMDSGILSLKNPIFDSLDSGIACKDSVTLSIIGGKFSNIAKTGIYGNGARSFSLKNVTMTKCGETGVLLSKVNLCKMDSSVFEGCGLSGVDANSCSKLVIANSNFKNNQQAGVVSTGTPTFINGGDAFGNKIVAFEFKKCKGTISQTEIHENSCAVICSDKGSCSINNAKISCNKQAALSLAKGSAGTIKKCVFDQNGILLSGRSIVKVRATRIKNCTNGIQVSGKKTAIDVNGSIFSKCKCGILITEEAIGTIGKNKFNDNNVDVEAREKSMFSSEKDIFINGKGDSSIVLLSKSEAVFKGAVFSKPGQCGIYGDDAKSITINNATMKGHSIAGVYTQKCSNLSVNGGVYNNGRAAVIVSGEGKSSITGITVKKASDAAVLHDSECSPTITGVKTKGKTSLSL